MPNCWSATMNETSSELLYTRVQTALRTLQLTQMTAELDALTAQAAAHNWSALEYLDHLCQCRHRVSRNQRDKMSLERRTAGPPAASATQWVIATSSSR